MVQAGDCPCLALETFAKSWIGCDEFVEHLDGDGAIEAGITGFVDFAHTALADRTDHFEVTQLVACRKWHQSNPCRESSKPDSNR